MKWFLYASAVVLLSMAGCATRPNWDGCTLPDGKYSNELVISQCTESINAPQISAYERAVAFAYRGIALDNRGEYERALADLDRAIQLEPTLKNAHYSRGIVWSNKGNHQRAIADFSTAIKLNPRHTDPLVYRGIAYSQVGQYDYALADLDAAIKIAPHASSYVNRGAIRLKNGNYDEAIADFDVAIQREPRLAAAFHNRGRARVRKGDYKRAVDDYDIAIQIDPKFPWARYSRGLARFYLASFALAEVDLEVANQSNPNPYTSIWLYLARARSGNDGTKELSRSAKSFELERWPGPIIKFFLGGATKDELVTLANTVPAASKSRICDTSFYIAQWNLIQENAEDSIAHLREVRKRCAEYPDQHDGALAELKRLGQ